MGVAFVQQSVISARFMTTFGHFIALLVLFSTIDNNINLSLPDTYSDEDRRTAANTAWVRQPLNSYCCVFHAKMCVCFRRRSSLLSFALSSTSPACSSARPYSIPRYASQNLLLGLEVKTPLLMLFLDAVFFCRPMYCKYSFISWGVYSCRG